MDEKTGKTIDIFIIILIVSLVALIGGIYTSGLPESYDWEGPAGSFAFRVDDRNPAVTFHLIKLKDIKGNIDNIPFEFGPEELESIGYNNEVSDYIFDKDFIYVIQNPEDSLILKGRAAITPVTITRLINKDIRPVHNLHANIAISEEYEGYSGEIEIVTCEDSSADIGVISLRYGNENSLYVENDCVILEYSDSDGSMKAATALVYHLLGVL
ncbi:hypothetical protein HOA59_02080 [archaeon]|nr:hypothetical protein [archaeon]MBT6824204.1 hypothetical protein [archaeon]MBT7297564.1 hypothetical protein [archaeon]